MYTALTKLKNFLNSYVEGVYTIQNGAYERNDLTAYSVGGHNIMLNWMMEITNLLQFFVVSVKFGSDYSSREVVLSFDNLNVNFFLPFSQKKHNVRPISDRVSATKKLDLGSILCLAFSNKKGLREDYTVCGRQNVAA